MVTKGRIVGTSLVERAAIILVFKFDVFHPEVFKNTVEKMCQSNTTIINTKHVM